MMLAGTLILPDSTGTVRLGAGWVRLDGGRIAEIGPGPSPATPDLGGEDCLISPGFIDAHTHLPQFDAIGIDGLPLLEWLDRVVYPAEARWEDADFAGRMCERVAGQLLRFGTTGVATYATVHHEAARAALAVLGESGLRGCVGQVLMDRGAPVELVRPAERLLRETASLMDADWPGRVRAAITPRFAITCTDELLRGCGELAAASGAPVQTHLAETPRECARVAELFGGLAYTEVYRRAGLLTPRSILAHGIHVDAMGRRLLAESGAFIAHCPTANAFLGSGRMDLAAHRRAGVGVCLGTDVAGGPDRSMVRIARAMIETARSLGHPAPTPAEAWHLITRGNAGALGWADSGGIEAGMWADLLVIRPDVPWRDSPDPLGTVLYGWDDRWLRQTIAAGRVVYDAGA